MIRLDSEPNRRNRPVLVLLHGFTGSSKEWDAQFPYLASHFEVFAVDLPGHGTNVPESLAAYSMESAADELKNQIEEISNTPVCLAGYSMGGRLALYFALQYPELIECLVLESASPGLETHEERAQRREQDEGLAQRIMNDGIEAFVDYWENLPLFASQRILPEAIQSRVRHQRLQNVPTGLANSLRGMGTGVQPSLWEQLPSLRLKTLLIAGELDEKFVIINSRMQKQMPNAELMIIAKAGHNVHLEQPEKYSEILIQHCGR